jgi:hypothetical protein
VRERFFNLSRKAGLGGVGIRRLQSFKKIKRKEIEKKKGESQ